ncbi:MAG: biotin/lipoyl-binding protein [Tessaracoccus sp.]|uniref:OadG family transporter subunit n=1 Tax=Tessaracoccus sp. TaxID=1971211 RepID=UPI001ED71EE1|nr:OadG family transporter subunit [Tessaracoccus sp.]MBK7821943.1 biotin/lipoyl-binding protein [Tessaracoccus sp.]
MADLTWGLTMMAVGMGTVFALLLILMAVLLLLGRWDARRAPAGADDSATPAREPEPTKGREHPTPAGMRRYTIAVDDKELVIDLRPLGGRRYRAQLDGKMVDVTLGRDGRPATITPVVAVRSVDTPRPAEPASSPQDGAAPSGPIDLTAPMPGLVLAIDAGVGATVERGDAIITLEAMKMVNQVRAPRGGVVTKVHVTAGDQVSYGDALARIEDAP